MSFEDFKTKVMDKDSPEHLALLTHVKERIDKSRCDMSKNYNTWDENDNIFRSLRKIDKEDQNSMSRGAPAKMILPLTFSQIMTFVAFNVMSITQNARFFELEPTGTEDNPLVEPIELILERDIRRNTWNTFLVQFFLDIGRFSLGAAEVCYREDYRYMRIPGEQTIEGAFGEETTQPTNNFQSIPVFIGNRVYSVSPYRFFPDTNLPLTRYQEGEFCGSEDQWTYSVLQGDENLFNLDKIPKFSEENYKQRKEISRIDLGPLSKEKNKNLLGFGTGGSDNTSTFVTSGPVAVTKCVIDITPANFQKGRKDFTSLGEEKFPVRYLCWYANDGTIIRFEEAYYLHCQFPYIAAQYLPDQHRTVNEGLADVCDQITTLITWKINAHVASQKNSVESKYIIDPAGIDVKSVESRSPYIFLKRNASQSGVDRYIKQFKTEDVTQNVMSDVAALKDLLEGVTGNSAQMQGQYSTGRRSATQDRVVAQGAGARGKTTLGGIWDSAFEPLGKQLIANNRQEMDLETFARIMGQRDWGVNPNVAPKTDPSTGAVMPVMYTTEDMFALFKADPVSIATAEDFFVFDGTSPSEKAFLAQSIQELLMTILQNPDIAPLLGYGPEQIKELINQVYLLRGVTPARLPKPTPTGVVSPDQGGGKEAKGPADIIKLGPIDLAGKERTQALAQLGIKADEEASNQLIKLEHPKPAARNGATSA